MRTPICFMIMPFGTKPTGVEVGKGPVDVDFDALWNKALKPTVEKLGYRAVRADQETGSLIIIEMLRRLAYADLVVADVSIPNANVYYEIGVRHAARDRNCVLIGAEWSKPVFDLGQMRRVSYPLVEGAVTEASAAQIASVLTSDIRKMINGTSPVFEAVPAFPNVEGNEEWVKAFADEVKELSEWSERKAGISAISDKDVRKPRALELRDELLGQAAISDGVWLEMLPFLRDATSDWQVVLDWIAAMPDHLRARPAVEEQRLLAQAKLKTMDLEERVGALKSLVERYGPSSERLGLLGGRHKDLYDRVCKALRESQDPAEKKKLESRAAQHLDDAIDAYRAGMLCDLNDYYPASNLPGLLKIRGEPGDEELARSAAGVTALACQRAKALGKKDPWLNPTLLLAAFQAGHVPLAISLVKQIRRDGAAAWQLDSVLRDLARTVDHTEDAETQKGLRDIIDQLQLVG